MTEGRGHFADRLAAASRRVGSPLCVGLDPHLEHVPACYGVSAAAPLSERTIAGVGAFVDDALEACTGRVAVVKPQIAFFEQLGHRGIALLERAVRSCRERGLLVLLDAKRGDIGSTAAAYARSYLSPDGPCPADAITLSPYLGLDSLEPFVAASRAHGVGLFVLARTSNPGAEDFQSRDVEGRPLYERVAEALSGLAESLRGESGWSNLGIVAGATYPETARRLRQLLPHSPFLVPGYGAQGAAVSDALAALVPRDGRLEGGLISSSRALLFGGESDTAAVRAGIAARIEAAKSEIARAALPWG
jgi:orotidine-5'-phosphate decarboxylase